MSQSIRRLGAFFARRHRHHCCWVYRVHRMFTVISGVSYTQATVCIDSLRFSCILFSHFLLHVFDVYARMYGVRTIRMQM